jgi:hypothetical protein
MELAQPLEPLNRLDLQEFLIAEARLTAAVARLLIAAVGYLNRELAPIVSTSPGRICPDTRNTPSYGTRRQRP